MSSFTAIKNRAILAARAADIAAIAASPALYAQILANPKTMILIASPSINFQQQYDAIVQGKRVFNWAGYPTVPFTPGKTRINESTAYFNLYWGTPTRASSYSTATKLAQGMTNIQRTQDRGVTNLAIAAALIFATAGYSAYAAAQAAETAGTVTATVPATEVSSSFSAAESGTTVNLANTSSVLSTAAAPTLNLTTVGGGFTAASTTVGTVTTSALTGSDLVGAALVNAGVDMTALATVAPTVASSMLSIGFSAASTPSIESVALVAPSTEPVTATPTTAPTTPPTALETAGGYVKTAYGGYQAVKSYQGAQAAKAAAGAKAALAQQQAAQAAANLKTIQDAQAAQAATQPGLTNLPTGLILSLIAAGAALLS